MSERCKDKLEQRALTAERHLAELESQVKALYGLEKVELVKRIAELESATRTVAKDATVDASPHGSTPK